jgi:hypothetical protein
VYDLPFLLVIIVFCVVCFSLLCENIDTLAPEIYFTYLLTYCTMYIQRAKRRLGDYVLVTKIWNGLNYYKDAKNTSAKIR